MIGDISDYDPSQRRVLIVLDRFKYDNLSRTGETGILTDREAHALITPLRGDHNSVVVGQLVRSGDLVPGSVLVQNPYNTNKYVRIGDSIDKICLEKALLFSDLCQMLGAKHIAIKELIFYNGVNNKSTQIAASGFKLSLAGINGNCKENQAWFSDIEVTSEFPGQTPDVEGAWELISECGLDQDVSIESFYRARRHARNIINKRTVNLRVSSEVTKNLAVAARLGLKKYGFCADVDIDYWARSSYVLKYEVTF